MNRALAIATLSLVTLASAFPAFAQREYRLEMKPQRPPGSNYGRHYQDVDYPTPEKRTANLNELLNFTNDQKQKVLVILTAQDQQASAIWSDESLSDAARAKKVADLRAVTTAKVRDLLTDEQKSKYDALNVVDRSKVPDRHPPNEP